MSFGVLIISQPEWSRIKPQVHQIDLKKIGHKQATKRHNLWLKSKMFSYPDVCLVSQLLSSYTVDRTTERITVVANGQCIVLP